MCDETCEKEDSWMAPNLDLSQLVNDGVYRMGKNGRQDVGRRFKEKNEVLF